MATATKAASSAKATRRAERSEVPGDARFWIIHQGREFYVVESDGQPDLTTEPGERAKVIQGARRTREGAEARAQELAEHGMGRYRA